MKVNRRTFLKNTGLGLLGLTVLGNSTLYADSDQRRPPNILFIFSDDHALQALGCYPTRLQDFIRRHHITPSIDRIAAEGAVFEHSFCCNSICGPSRAAVLTGKHSHINGFIDNSNKPFDGSQWTFPKAFQAAGYQTALFGKWHLISNPTGFDRWEILPDQGQYYNPVFISPAGRKQQYGYVTDIITDKTIDWLSHRDTTKPFMVMCQHKAPHRPWLPPLQYLDLLKDQTVPDPETLFDDYQNRASPASQQEMTIDQHMTLTSDLKVLPTTIINPNQIPGEIARMTPQQRKAWDAYYNPRNEAFRKANLQGKELVRWKYQQYLKDYLGCIKSIDDNVGRLLAWLDESGLSDNTIVIYCADQGFYLGEHGWYDKRWMYEESLAMPFIIRWPGVVKAGSRFKPMIQNIDYAPTFLEIAGLTIPPEIQGRSFVSILKGQIPDDWRKSVYYHYYEFPQPHHVPPHRGVRTEQYKLVHYYRTDEWECFDLKTDPQEMRSVYADPAYAEIVQELKQELARLEKQYQVPPLAQKQNT